MYIYTEVIDRGCGCWDLIEEGQLTVAEDCGRCDSSWQELFGKSPGTCDGEDMRVTG